MDKNNKVETNKIRNTEFQVTKLGFGGVPLGNYNYPISSEQAIQTLETAFQEGITYFDTAPWYGTGLSERRFGLGLHQIKNIQVSTKVGRFLVPDPEYEKDKDLQDFWKERGPCKVEFDYTKEGFQRQYHESLLRLGRTSVDALIIHDLEPSYHKKSEDLEKYYDQLFGSGEGIKGLQSLKKEGKIKVFGAGLNFNNELSYMQRYIDDLIANGCDFLMSASTPTLLEQNVTKVKGIEKIDIVLAAPFCSGILAGNNNFNYKEASKETVEKVEKIKQICKKYDIPIQSAAIQYPFQIENVKCVVVGAKSPKQIKEDINYFHQKIPNQFWEELRQNKIIP